MKTNLIVALALAMSLGAYAQQQNPLLQNEEKITEIIQGMTLEEKVEMLHGKHLFSSAGIERLGIPDIEYADGPFGIREELHPDSWMPLGWETDKATFFPTGSALAATWSPEMAYEYGKGMAVEARLRGKDMILGPAINIQRIPTGGRTYEYFSEDPLLSGVLAVAYTEGVQDNGAAACLKHYALNNQENNRGTVNVNISERAMREIYLVPFEMAVKEANAYGAMSAYNKVWGKWCSENDLLQNHILRNEWGFRGMIISDWGGTHSTVGAAFGGLDVEMPGKQYLGQALIDSVRSGAVPMEVIDAKVRNILRVRFAVDPVPAEEANTQMTSQPAQQQIAYDVASRSIVLLKNDGILPISPKAKTIAVIGNNTTRIMAQGGIGAGVKALYEVTPLEGLQRALKGKAKIKFAEGYTPAPRPRWGQTEPIDLTAYYAEQEKLHKEAVALAKKADIVIFIGGDNREVESEAMDRTTIELPFGQDKLLADIAAVNPNIVTVIVAGAPVDLTTVDKLSQAVVYSWFNGTEGGNALADVLTGKISPSGKLPFTLPLKLEDVPAYALGVYPQNGQTEGDVFVTLVNSSDFNAAKGPEADYDEGIFVGYRWYATKDVPTAYPFGHGLSYAPFTYTDASAQVEGDNLIVRFNLANGGDCDAEEVAQVYVSRPDSKVERPARELKGFQRVAVKAGETKQMEIVVPLEHLRHWNEFQHNWNVEPGRVVISIGTSSENLPINCEVTI